MSDRQLQWFQNWRLARKTMREFAINYRWAARAKLYRVAADWLRDAMLMRETSHHFAAKVKGDV